MNWEEAAAMRRGGMAVGSHTHTHALLAKLPPESQRDEMACSKAIIERELGVPCEALAYPYGLPSSIGSETPELARQAGYRLAFSFHGGVNRAGADPYRLQRSGPSAETGTSRFRMQTLTAAVSGRYSY